MWSSSSRTSVSGAATLNRPSVLKYCGFALKYPARSQKIRGTRSLWIHWNSRKCLPKTSEVFSTRCPSYDLLSTMSINLSEMCSDAPAFMWLKGLLLPSEVTVPPWFMAPDEIGEPNGYGWYDVSAFLSWKYNCMLSFGRAVRSDCVNLVSSTFPNLMKLCSVLKYSGCAQRNSRRRLREQPKRERSQLWVWYKIISELKKALSS